jgi:uncharacterized membrane protein YgcG
VIARVESILNKYNSGQISKQDALKQLAELRQGLRKSLKDDPVQLALKKSDMQPQKPSSPKPSSGSGGGGSGSGGGSGTSGTGGGGRFWKWLTGQ